ncbi:MAG: transglycosylase domain-containing protein, partial [Burkholderiales bacterium]
MARRARILKYFRIALGLGALALAGFVFYLDLRVRSEFEGRRFALPARIYARPLELHAGLRIARDDVEDELRELSYAAAPREAPGWYLRGDNQLEIAVRPFIFWDGAQPARRVRIAFQDGTVASLTDEEGRDLPLVRLEPMPIGGIYPAGNEDRLLVRLKDVPPHLVKELLVTEDRNFYTHHGFDPRGLARAVLSLGSTRVQGGSTITQQLVKNFFLTPERTLTRKFTELVMAVL